MKICKFFTDKKTPESVEDVKQLFYDTLQKKAMYALNIKHNEGWVRSDLDGTVLEKNNNG